jgi:23S rRNA A2030 N6-methylase RlmJ
MKTDDLIIREYVDLVGQLIRSLTKRSYGDWQRVQRLERMGVDVMRVADRMVGIELEPEDEDDHR